MPSARVHAQFWMPTLTRPFCVIAAAGDVLFMGSEAPILQLKTGTNALLARQGEPERYGQADDA